MLLFVAAQTHDRRRSPTPGLGLERGGGGDEDDEMPSSGAKKLRWHKRGVRSTRRVIDDDDDDDDAGADGAARGPADADGAGDEDDGEEDIGGDPHAALRGREPSRRIASAPRRRIGDDDDDDGVSEEDDLEDESEDDDDDAPRVRRPDRRRPPPRSGGREMSRRRGGSAKRGRGGDSEDFHGEDEEEEEDDDESDESETDSDEHARRAPGRRRASKRQRQQVQRFSPKREDEREQLAPAGLRSGRGGAGGSGGGGQPAANGRRHQRRYYAEDLVAGVMAGAAGGGAANGAPGGGLGGHWLNDAAAAGPPAASWPALAPGAGGSLVPGGSGVPPTPGAAAAAGRGLEGAGGGRGGAEIITPLVVDPSLTFDQVGGLQRYVAALKEMVFLPLLYPEVFERFALAPPRGVLLYGPPGTGKTLLARALAASCGRAGARVSFFMRKGADILSKWVGESERQLRLLFEEAQRQQPSIIFFDEIDGLAPVRSSKSDQIHNSLVSTLLALMDGLDSRGRIVVIGATNRVDAIDGALRRPGRFDRELAFPLPNASARREILDIHTRGWAAPPESHLLERLADACVGYCGADLKALATEAAVRALRRRYPQIYASEAKLAIDPSTIRVSAADWDAARAGVVPAAHRGAAAHARPLPAGQRTLLGGALAEASAALGRLFPPAAAAGVAGAADAAPGAGSAAAARRCVPLGMRLAAADSGDDDDDEDEDDPEDAEASAVAAILAAASLLARRPRLLLAGAPGAGQGALAAALLHSLEMFPVHALGLPSLLADGGARSAEEALVAAVAEARRAAPAVLYLPHVGGWWDAAGPMLRATLTMLLEDLPPELPLLLLATADGPLEAEVLGLFSGDQVLSVGPPDAAARAGFWKGALAAAAAGASRAASRAAARRRLLRRALAPPPLALAPVSAAEAAAAAAASSAALAAAAADSRALRAFLRDALAGLLPDRRWKDFWAQPSEEAFPGWREATGPRPVDLTRMLGRVNEGAYAAPSHFLADVAALPGALVRYFGGQPAERDDAVLVSRAYALADHLGGVMAQLDASLAARLEQAARNNAPQIEAAAAPGAAAAAAAATAAAAEASAAAARATRRTGTEPLPDLKVGARSAPDPEELVRQQRAARRLEEAARKAEADAVAAAEAAEQAARDAAAAAEREAAEARERAVREAAEAAAAAAREAAEAAEREARCAVWLPLMRCVQHMY
jgi:SpoVK/Ycf46/Vps4 family AAA+-type ATPase